jgi:hypothetical protein
VFTAAKITSSAQQAAGRRPLFYWYLFHSDIFSSSTPQARHAHARIANSNFNQHTNALRIYKLYQRGSNAIAWKTYGGERGRRLESNSCVPPAVRSRGRGCQNLGSTDATARTTTSRG